MELTFEQKLMAAVWMVGNIDTEEDKRAWWRTYNRVWMEVRVRSEDVQAWADQMAELTTE